MPPCDTRLGILGVGIDIAQVDRLRSAYDRGGESFLERVFTERELEYCRRFPDPFPHLAARFAAKESVIKALGIACDPLDIEIERDEGRPRVVLHGRAKAKAAEMGVRELHISLSHTGGVAAAVALAVAR